MLEKYLNGVKSLAPLPVQQGALPWIVQLSGSPCCRALVKGSSGKAWVHTPVQH